MPVSRLASAWVALALVTGVIAATGVTAAAAPGGEFKATVLSVGEGDTLRVSIGGKPITSGWPATAKAAPSRKPDGFEPPRRRRAPMASSLAATSSSACHAAGR